MKYLILLIDKNELPIIRIELSYPRTTSEKIYTWNHNIKERNIVYNGEISKIYTLFRLGTNITTTIELLYKYTIIQLQYIIERKFNDKNSNNRIIIYIII